MPVDQALPSVQIGLLELLSGPDNGILMALLGANAVVVLLGLALLRWRRRPLITVVPVFLASVILTALGLSVVRRSLTPAYLRLAAAVALPFEILGVGWVVYVVFRAVRGYRRAGTDGDFHERTLEAVRGAAGKNLFGDIVATEVSVLYPARPSLTSPTDHQAIITYRAPR